MIDTWPWYLSGLALASVPLLHWLGLGRSLAVSGRFTALVNRLRFGDSEPEVEISQDELLEAMRQATIAAFGAEAVKAPTASGEMGARPERLSSLNHLLFLLAILVGGALSALLAGAWDPAFELRSETFNGIFDSPLASAAALGGGGLLVGFGTRMAAGCTSGHGLCGVSRFQKGSMAATAAFFGAAIVVSMLLKAVSS